MLALTPEACTTITTLSETSELGEDAGLRIAVSQEPPTAGQLAASLTPGPQPEDTVLEAEGAQVFLEPAAADALDDKVLHVESDGNGTPQFAIAEQEG